MSRPQATCSIDRINSRVTEWLELFPRQRSYLASGLRSLLARLGVNVGNATGTCPHCGCEIERRSRSLPDHRRLFGLIRKAWMNWPEHHPMQFTNKKTFRG